MSSNSSPNRTSPMSYEAFYDPSFTAEITSKMHVPDKICVVEGIEPPPAFSNEIEMKTKMNVPERIVVAGDNKHFALREAMPELKFDTPFPMNFQNMVLAPPPDVLTVDEYPYIEETKQTNAIKKKPQMDHTLNGTADLNESAMSSCVTPAEEMAMLRRQFRHLSRRLMALEQETQQIRQRELIFCTVASVYILLKGLSWLHKHF